MSRKYNIRWQESDTQELARAVKNFNAKISRIEKKHPELKNSLPERMKVGELKNLINTRQDLKREINSLKRFTDKNNKIGKSDDGEYEGIEIYGDYNIKITKWQRKEINRRIATINTKRKKRLEALKQKPVKSRGEEQGYTVEQVGVGSTLMNELAPMEGLTKGASNESVRRKYKSALIQSQSDFLTLKDFRTKSSYITGLYRNFNEDEIKDIVEAIEKMPIEKFLDTFQSDNDAKFEGLYPGNKAQEREYIKSLRAVWLPNKKDTSPAPSEKKEARKKKTVKAFNNELDILKEIEPINGYINVFAGDEKIGRFSTGQEAVKYIKKHKLSDIKYNISK